MDIINDENLEYCASDMMLPKRKRIRSEKILKSARGKQCTVNLNGICNYDKDTVVFAHLGGAGGALKHHDYKGAYSCNKCHDEVDRRTTIMDSEFVDHEFKNAMIKTLDLLVEQGLVIIK